MPTFRSTLTIILVLLVLTLSACTSASYVTPGRGVDMAAMGWIPEVEDGQTDESIAEVLSRRPQARFPARVAMARVQATGYSSYASHGFGHGAYCVVTNRDFETEEHLAKLATLPEVTAVARMNRLLVPSRLQDDGDLRRGAAALHADLLLLYTMDTIFHNESSAAPLALVTLGLFPTNEISVSSTSSAVLMDTRNGYVYGVAESTARGEDTAGSWTTRSAIDTTRRETEARAFGELVDELGTMWRGVLDQYATPREGNRPQSALSVSRAAGR